MRLELRFFASAREAVGSAGFALEVQRAPVSVAELLDQIDPEHKQLQLRNSRLRVAINGRILDVEEPLLLQHGDEVAFLPPVTGG